ncbi:MAG: tRNA 5-methoxyuridine(34)/uridine 5-oxyacetic acid(34) synthase CmoB [Desulfobacterales bacterium]|jgi:tRNA (mo5U34)-methyltransferase|nr:tRNA 5-methoxyuridine(34)/uridine 5-oxyacetic acid(34) synthase CmoB [Desulfobacteraceae bacterium]MBT4363868.1 tRNA 5-methoxyuridine(34)/uridine 5-oxyacetic acid(34) synthase CmoB [Desulfobacteraceae bacterium]MBT7086611.1 tRNA 5-methoxyuridine(34)/uridine 5-oxyacetic acid(34) synthase CmoB [Desulfobacterales bacterium]MBT7696511.1 tRNA 5-methoxyuridine(34)/uridine 5-oxyacetic acid(34) synthase CmoB [Desulfobacterales bacterium]
MDKLINRIKDLKIFNCFEELKELIKERQHFISKKISNDEILRHIFNNLPDIKPSNIDLDSDSISIGKATDLNNNQYENLYKSLQAIGPWRKGPFDFFGIHVKSEWASYIKWNRIKDHITPLTGRRILDIGCSSGYYMFRMSSSKPKMVLGIEPYLTFYYQYLLIRHFINAPDIFFVPIKLEEMPNFNYYFDTIFCMGILYHRKSPIDTLKQIHMNMVPGGELVLETLVIEGDEDIALFPEDRYAKMRNVFFIPTNRCLTSWLKRAGFKNIRCVDTSPTTLTEQRKTEWIKTETLEDFLDQKDPKKTIEGYPAPLRSVLIANS